MAKDSVITIRIDSEDKKSLEGAARRRGLTLSAFLVQTVLKEARSAPRRRRGARRSKVPTFFRTACAEASRGGAGGYMLPGRILIEHALATLEEDALDALAEITFDESSAGVLSWCDEHFSEGMKIVPARRREQFAQGIIDAYTELEDERDAAHEEVLAREIEAANDDAEA